MKRKLWPLQIPEQLKFFALTMEMIMAMYMSDVKSPDSDVF